MQVPGQGWAPAEAEHVEHEESMLLGFRNLGYTVRSLGFRVRSLGLRACSIRYVRLL